MFFRSKLRCFSEWNRIDRTKRSKKKKKMTGQIDRRFARKRNESSLCKHASNRPWSCSMAATRFTSELINLAWNDSSDRSSRDCIITEALEPRYFPVSNSDLFNYRNHAINYSNYRGPLGQPRFESKYISIDACVALPTVTRLRNAATKQAHSNSRGWLSPSRPEFSCRPCV